MINSYDIQVSTRCSLDCKHCCMKSHLNNRKTEFDKIQRVINEDPSITEIHLSGGEPLCTNTSNLLSFLTRNYKYKTFSMTTNLIYKLDYRRELILKKIDHLHTSFDPKIRFASVKQLSLWYHNLKKVRKILDLYNRNIDVFVCLTRELIKIDPKRIVRFFNKLNIDYTIIPLMCYGSALYNSMVPQRLEAEKWLYRLISLDDRHNKTAKLIKNRNFTNCQYGATMQCIDFKGDKVQCIVDHNCNYKGKIQKRCSECSNLFMCGGTCTHIGCYFFEDLYKKIIYNK